MMSEQKYQVPVTGSLPVPGTLVPGTWYQVPGSTFHKSIIVVLRAKNDVYLMSFEGHF